MRRAGSTRDERLVGVRRVQRLVQQLGRDALGEPGRGGGEDPAGHRREHRRERQRDLLPRGLGERLLDLGGVLVRAADLVRRELPHDRAREQRVAGLAPRAGGAAGGHDDDVVRLDEAGGEQRCQAEDHAGGIAAGVGDATARADQRPLAVELGHAVGPGARVRAAVVALPGLRRLEPVVGAQVDHDRAVLQVGGDRAGLAVRQREEDDVGLGEGVGVGRDERAVAQGGEMRVQRGDPRTGAAARRQRADGEVGVAEQQAHELAPA